MSYEILFYQQTLETSKSLAILSGGIQIFILISFFKVDIYFINLSLYMSYFTR